MERALSKRGPFSRLTTRTEVVEVSGLLESSSSQATLQASQVEDSTRVSSGIATGTVRGVIEKKIRLFPSGAFSFDRFSHFVTE